MTTLSPSARGAVPGLLLALAAAMATLGANRNWLLPAIDDESVAYLTAAPLVAQGAEARVPLARWDSGEPSASLAGRGRTLPLLMGAAVRSRARPHVAAIWVVGTGAALLAFTAAWIAGGAAGVPGALLAGIVVIASALTAQVVTVIRPEALVAGLVGVQLGVMTYRPRWSLAHGLAGAAAWLTHPVGLGAVLAAALWPTVREGGVRGRAHTAALAPTATLVVAGLAVHPLLMPPVPYGLAVGGPAGPWGASVAELLRWAGAGVGGAVGVALGALVLAAMAYGIARVDPGTPAQLEELHWKDPAVPGALTRELMRAAALLAGCLVLSGLVAGRGDGGLARPLFAATVPLALLAVVPAARAVRQHGTTRVVTAAALALWLALSGWNARTELLTANDDGRGHTTARWVSSEVIRWVDNRSQPYATLYATDPGLIFIQTGRVARGLPAGPADLDAFAEAFRSRPGAIVITPRAGATVTADTLAATLGVDVTLRGPDGTVMVPVEAGSGG